MTLRCWICRKEVDPERTFHDKQVFACPHCGIENQYQALGEVVKGRTIAPRATGSTILRNYNAKRLKAYAARYQSGELDADLEHLGITLTRNEHNNIIAWLWIPFVTAFLFPVASIAWWLIQMAFDGFRLRPFWHYEGEVYFDRNKKHFVVVEPRFGRPTPIVLVPARGARIDTWDFIDNNGEGSFAVRNAGGTLFFGRRITALTIDTAVRCQGYIQD